MRSVIDVLKRIPRLWSWTVTLIVILSAAAGVVIITRKSVNGYGCLQAGSIPISYQIIDLTSGKKFLAPTNWFDRDRRLVGSWAIDSPDNTKLAYTWVSDKGEWSATLLDKLTFRQQTVALDIDRTDARVQDWSTDGKYFFVYEIINHGYHIDEVFDGSTLQRALTVSSSAIQWSPQGHQLASLEWDYSNPDVLSMKALSILPLDRGAAETISLVDKIPVNQRQKYGGVDMQWSPDGRYIALSNAGQIWLYDVQKHTFKEAANDVYVYFAYGENISIVQWTPHGNLLFYMAYADREEQSLRVFDPKSWSSKTLATRSKNARPPGFFEFSPDGKFALTAKGGVDNVPFTYSILNLDTGQETVNSIGKGEEPGIIWSPDSNGVVWQSNGEFFWARTDGSQKRRINELDNFTLSSQTGLWLGYDGQLAGHNYAAIFNTQTGDYHIFREAYPDVFEVHPSPNGQMAALIFKKFGSHLNLKVKLVSIDDQWSSTFETNTVSTWRLFWSPDSSLLALYTDSGNRTITLHLLRADGTELRQIDNLTADPDFYRWTNCGRD